MARRDLPGGRRAVAVIDIGSNSGRVAVYGADPGSSGHLRILAGSRAPLQLVTDLDETGQLGEARPGASGCAS